MGKHSFQTVKNKTFSFLQRALKYLFADDIIVAIIFVTIYTLVNMLWFSSQFSNHHSLS